MDDLFQILFNEISHQYDRRQVRRQVEPDQEIDDLYNQFNYDSSFRTNQDIIDNMHYIRRHLQNERELAPVTRDTTDLVNVTTHSFFRPSLDETSFLVSRNLDTFINEFMSVWTHTEEFGQIPDEDFEDVKVSLSEEEYCKLEKITVDSNNLSLYGDKCNICLYEIDVNQDIVLLKCKHYFHDECLRSWLTKQSTRCCTCRYDCRV